MKINNVLTSVKKTSISDGRMLWTRVKLKILVQEHVWGNNQMNEWRIRVNVNRCNQPTTSRDIEDSFGSFTLTWYFDLLHK